MIPATLFGMNYLYKIKNTWMCSSEPADTSQTIIKQRLQDRDEQLFAPHNS